MNAQFRIRSHDMPAEMQVLLNQIPRDSWETHPGFQEKTRQWLNAHQNFRRLAELVRKDTEAYLDKEMSVEDYERYLAVYGNRLVGNLHGHHGWEDHSYFPELSAADPRFDKGLELLEKDHADLDAVLDVFTRSANRAIKLAHLDPDKVRDEAGDVHEQAIAIEAFLDRHLSDEEELAVPIILHHRLRG